MRAVARLGLVTHNITSGGPHCNAGFGEFEAVHGPASHGRRAAVGRNWLRRQRFGCLHVASWTRAWEQSDVPDARSPGLDVPARPVPKAAAEGRSTGAASILREGAASLAAPTAGDSARRRVTSASPSVIGRLTQQVGSHRCRSAKLWDCRF